MRILIIMPWKPSLGCIKKWLTSLSNEFRNLGHRVYVFSPYNLPTPIQKFLILFSNFPPLHKRLGMIWELFIKTILYMPISLVLTLANDYIISFYPPDSIMFQIFSKMLKKRNITVVHQVIGTRLVGLDGYFWVKHHLLSHKVIAISPRTKSDVEKIYGVDSKKVVVIYNGLNLRAIEEISCNVKLKGSPAIIYVGRLEFIKGPDILLKAFKIVHEKNPHAFLHILGDGSLRKKLERIAESLEIRKYVKFYGFVSPPYEYMKAADILVIPSRYDAMPTVSLEAMACNVPIVATDVGGLRDIIVDYKNGIKALPKPHDIADKIALLWNDERLRINIKNFQQKFIQNFTWKRAAKEYLRVMKNP